MRGAPSTTLGPVYSVDIITHKQVKGIMYEPSISDKKGNTYASRAIDNCLHGILEDLFEDKPSLFPGNIPGKEELRQRFQTSQCSEELPTPRLLN
jgi:hypothetical protein